MDNENAATMELQPLFDPKDRHNSLRQTGGDQDGTTFEHLWGIQRTTAELMTEFNQPD